MGLGRPMVVKHQTCGRAGKVDTSRLVQHEIERQLNKTENFHRLGDMTCLGACGSHARRLFRRVARGEAASLT